MTRWQEAGAKVRPNGDSEPCGPSRRRSHLFTALLAGALLTAGIVAPISFEAATHPLAHSSALAQGHGGGGGGGEGPGGMPGGGPGSDEGGPGGGVGPGQGGGGTPGGGFAGGAGPGSGFAGQPLDPAIERAQRRYLEASLQERAAPQQSQARGFIPRPVFDVFERGLGAPVHNFSHAGAEALIARGWAPRYTAEPAPGAFEGRPDMMVQLSDVLGFPRYAGALQAHFGTPQEIFHQGFGDKWGVHWDAYQAQRHGTEWAQLPPGSWTMDQYETFMAAAKPGEGPADWYRFDLDVCCSPGAEDGEFRGDGVVDSHDLDYALRRQNQR